MNSKTITVSDNLSILTYPPSGVTLMSAQGKVEGAMFVEAAELPALLDALQTAAEGMGVSTVQAELVKACKGLLEYRRRNDLNFQLEKADDFMRQIEQALEAK